MNEGPILLVEDNPDDEALILRTFSRSNIANEIIVARDGAEALDQLFGNGATAERGPLKPALVMLDLKLPKVDGLEVLQRIRGEELTHRLPVVILTSSDEQQDLIRSYDLGANSYVRKPVDFSEFANAIVELGLYWIVRNVSAPS